MERERLSVEGDTLFIWDSAGHKSEQRLQDLSRVQVVFLANGLFQGEEPFYILAFEKSVWVIPDDAAGLVELWRAIKPVAQGRVERVTDAHLPWTWRKRTFGLLPIFPLPRMGVFDASSLPHWPYSGTIEPGQYDTLI